MFFFLLLLACCTASAQVSGPTQFRPQIFDVQHYDARITFPDPAQRTIVADVSIIVKWTASASNTTFPFHLRDLIIDSVFVNDVATTIATKGAPTSDTLHHATAIPHAVTNNRVDTIRVLYHGTMTNEGGDSPWGGAQYQDSVLYCLGVGFKNSYVSATQHWLACYDHPSDKATFVARFTVPESPWKVASNGIEIFTRPPWPDGMAIYTWSESHATSTYLLTFAVAPYRKIEMDGVVPHVFYTLARDSVKSARSYAKVPRMTSYFAGLYGAYPFDKVGYCNTTKGAMEHQTMISFPVSKVQQNDTINATAAHELAHQWFGDNVSPLDFRYAWLTESFATYSECAWVEELRGASVYLVAVAQKAKDYIKNISVKEKVFSLEDFPRLAPSSNYPQTIYQKGAVVVAMMRAIAGDKPFYSAMKKYQSSHQYSTATTQDMKEALLLALGTKTDAFFDEWVTGIGWAQLNVDQFSSGSDVLVTINQVQRNLHPTWPIFTTLPLNVVYTRNGFAGIDTIDTIMYPDSAGHIEFICTQFLSVNEGNNGRALVEVLENTHSFNDNRAATEPAPYTIAPNPANDTVQLLRVSTSRAITIHIVDLLGKTVLTQTCLEGATQCPLDVSHLPAGRYQVVVEGEDGVQLPLVITRGQ